MVVEVRLFAMFRQGRFKDKKIDLPDASSLANLLDHLEIPHDQVHILLINGVSASADHVLSPKDVVAVFPPMGGG